MYKIGSKNDNLLSFGQSHYTWVFPEPYSPNKTLQQEFEKQYKCTTKYYKLV